MKEFLVVDGYNVIFAWPELKQLATESLEHARIALQEILQNYGRYKGYEEVVLVFDGKKSKEPASVERISKDFMLVFTGAGETADGYIERMVHEREGRFVHIYVVTSDGAEQHQILGSGGLRIPVRELRKDVASSKKEEESFYKDVENSGVREGLSGLLNNDEVARKLNELRFLHKK